MGIGESLSLNIIMLMKIQTRVVLCCPHVVKVFILAILHRLYTGGDACLPSCHTCTPTGKEKEMKRPLNWAVIRVGLNSLSSIKHSRFK